MMGFGSEGGRAPKGGGGGGRIGDRGVLGGDRGGCGLD